jgi:hypothetical protein
MSDEPPRKQEPDNFKQHYAGTSIAKGQIGQHDSKKSNAQAQDANKEDNGCWGSMERKTGLRT